ncbi:MAG: DNA repair protein RecO [Candidatus Yanofskybacteria bacterium]|nr:DNA repair protein RecO [Candidatus Yanofskybacteria bacterium]
MSVHYRTHAFVLAYTDYEEADRAYTVYTKEFGKLQVWAVSVRKITSKLRGGLMPFCISDIEFVQGRSKKTATEAVPVRWFSRIREDEARMRIASRMLRQANSIVKGEEADPVSWSLFFSCLAALDEEQVSLPQCLLAEQYFFWNFVSRQGYQPRISEFPRESAQLLEWMCGQDLMWVLNHADAAHVAQLRSQSDHYLYDILEGVRI